MSPTEVVLGARPFLKWAGSKRWLVDTILDHIPETYGDYHEPFIGSASVFFALHSNARHHYLSDSIEPLINCYRQVASHPDRIISHANSWSGDRESYYIVRSQDEKDDCARAAKFIYLNRLCFNGLYRENGSGNFNVPYGRPRSTTIIHDAPALKRAAAVLGEKVTLTHQDFSESLEHVKRGDFVYLDPPYISGHKNNGFVDYNAKVFSWDDQHRLLAYVDELTERGAFFLLSNANHQSIRDLYATYDQLPIERFSSMSARAGARGATEELLLSNAHLASA